MPNRASSREERFQRAEQKTGQDNPADQEEADKAYQQGKVEGKFYRSVPKDYRRTDGDLREDIEQELRNHSETSGALVFVDVEDGHVVLEGIVDAVEVRKSAEAVVNSVLGVRGLDNRLEVIEPREH